MTPQEDIVEDLCIRFVMNNTTSQEAEEKGLSYEDLILIRKSSIYDDMYNFIYGKSEGGKN